MRRLALALFLVAVHFAVLGQGMVRAPQLDTEATLALKELRLERAQANINALRLPEHVKSRLSQTKDHQLLQTVLARQSVLGPGALSSEIDARIFLNAVATEAQDAAVRDYLQRRGIRPVKLQEEAQDGLAPTALANTVRGKLVAGKPGGVVLLRGEEVLITRGEDLYAGTVSPGQHVPVQGAQPSVWSAGLTYAGALAKRAGAKFNVQCTGTVVERIWFLTAAHCLLDELTGKRLENGDLSVFLPFQQGKEAFIGFKGRRNENMRRIAVVDSVWAGGEAGEPFPRTLEGFSAHIRSGKDLALLKLDTSQVSALPNKVPDIRLYANTPPMPPATMIGYGVSDKQYLADSDLGVGVRTSIPAEFKSGRPFFAYGPPAAQGGICGGDSGGGMFAGKVTGQESVLYIIAISSGLVGTVRSDANLCVASEQVHISLVADGARNFLCKHAPGACTATP